MYLKSIEQVSNRNLVHLAALVGIAVLSLLLGTSVAVAQGKGNGGGGGGGGGTGPTWQMTLIDSPRFLSKMSAERLNHQGAIFGFTWDESTGDRLGFVMDSAGAVTIVDDFLSPADQEMWTYIDWIDGGFSGLGQIATSAIHAPTGEFRAIRLTPPGPGESYYVIDDLGADPIEQQRSAHAIDNFGNVVGCSGNPYYNLAYVNSPFYGFQYLNGAPSLTGGYSAYEIEDSGAIVGTVSIGQSGGSRAVHWTDDSTTPSLIPYIALGAGGKAYGKALDTSNDGWIVGASSAGKSGQTTIIRAFRFKIGSGALTNLGTLGGSSYATSINDHHEIVGYCVNYNGAYNNVAYRLFYYSDTTGMIDLWNNITNLSAGVSLSQPGLLNSPDNNNLRQILVPIQLADGTRRAAILTPNQ